MDDLRFFKKWAEGIIPGGKAEEDSLQPGQVDQEQLAEGTETELEHAENVDLAKEIAMDHLAEIPDYYERLEKMEEEALKEGPEEEKPAPTTQDVAGFLAQSESAPDDDAFHEWAEANGYDKHKAEAAAYQLAKEKADAMKTASQIADRILHKLSMEMADDNEAQVGTEKDAPKADPDLETTDSEIAPVPDKKREVKKTAGVIADIVLRNSL